MPITFGSVGDIIAVCLLVKDLAEALDEARGSRKEYQFVIQQLRILDRTLLEIDLLTKALDNATTPGLRGLCKTAKDAEIQCKTLIDTFLEQVKRYKSSFDESQDPGLFREVVAKVRWRIGEKEALEKFRTDIANANSNLQTLLTATSVALMDLNRKEAEKRFTSLDQQNIQSNAQQIGALEHIRQRIDSTQQQLDIATTILNQISSTLRFDWLRQLGSELKGLMSRAIATNVMTYHAVVSLQSALPSRLERTLVDEPFILEDPIGRIAPIHLQFVTSWEAFHAVMEDRFSTLQGYRKMQERQYGLQEGATGREIERKRPWQRAFRPGQRVEMAFIFQSEGIESANAENTTCPGCQTPSNSGSDAEIQCQKCHMSYRRITVMEEVEPISQKSLSRSKVKTNAGGSEPFRQNGLTSNNLEVEEDIREFKRVRLMQTKKPERQRQSNEEQVDFRKEASDLFIRGSQERDRVDAEVERAGKGLKAASRHNSRKSKSNLLQHWIQSRKRRRDGKETLEYGFEAVGEPSDDDPHDEENQVRKTTKAFDTSRWATRYDHVYIPRTEVKYRYNDHIGHGTQETSLDQDTYMDDSPFINHFLACHLHQKV